MCENYEEHLLQFIELNILRYISAPIDLCVTVQARATYMSV